MNKGIIKSLNPKGFGFITVEGLGKDLFFHATNLTGVRFDELRTGDVVIFDDIEETEKGKQAVGVTVE